MTFFKTYNVFDYLMTPVVTEALYYHHLFACHPITFYVTHFNIYYTSPTHHLRTNINIQNTLTESTTHTLPQTHIHTHIRTNSKIYIDDSKLCSFLIITSCRTYALQLQKKYRQSCKLKNLSLILDSATLFSLASRTLALPSKTPSQIPNSSLRIPSC